MKKSLVLPLLALVFLSWDASAQSGSSRARRGSSRSSVAGPLGSVERTRLLGKAKSPIKVPREEARLGSAERRALLTGSRTSLLYPRRRG